MSVWGRVLKPELMPESRLQQSVFRSLKLSIEHQQSPHHLRAAQLTAADPARYSNHCRHPTKATFLLLACRSAHIDHRAPQHLLLPPLDTRCCPYHASDHRARSAISRLPAAPTRFCKSRQKIEDSTSLQHTTTTITRAQHYPETSLPKARSSQQHDTFTKWPLSLPASSRRPVSMRLLPATGSQGSMYPQKTADIRQRMSRRQRVWSLKSST